MGHTGCLTGKHFKDSVVGSTFLQWEELDQQILCLLCVLLGSGLWRTLKKRPSLEDAQSLAMIADIHTF